MFLLILWIHWFNVSHSSNNNGNIPVSLTPIAFWPTDPLPVALCFAFEWKECLSLPLWSWAYKSALLSLLSTKKPKRPHNRVHCVWIVWSCLGRGHFKCGFLMIYPDLILLFEGSECATLNPLHTSVLELREITLSSQGHSSGSRPTCVVRRWRKTDGDCSFLAKTKWVE